MADSRNTGRFYDDLAPTYDLIFADWEASTARHAAALAPLLDRGTHYDLEHFQPVVSAATG